MARQRIEAAARYLLSGSRVWTVARKILFYDRVKFAVASAGVSISVMLVLVQVGLYRGFMQLASSVIDNGRAEIWVASAGSENFDFPARMDERSFYRVASTPGVARAERMLMAVGLIKLDSGRELGVQVVGLEPGSRLHRPWSVVAGDAARLGEPGAITVDRTEQNRLGIDRVGHRTEINGARAEVVAMTEGIRSFTTTPLVFTEINSARVFTRFPADACTYVLVDVEDGVPPTLVRDRLRRLPHLEAWTRDELSERTRRYWSQRTGVGVALLASAALGVIVGLVVVGQILYNGTLEHLREYGTLKAMGARNSMVVRVILYQALLSAALGLVIGSALALGARAVIAGAHLTVALTPGLVAATAVGTTAMCSLAALLSILKVLRLDPAAVFRS